MRFTAEIAMLERAAESLRPLLTEVVFVGGSIVGLLLTDPSAPVPRATKDIDLIVEVGTRMDYYAIESQFEQLGFVRNTIDKILCRWNGHGLAVDLMPTNEQILGFANPWFRSGMVHAIPILLPSETQIRILDAPHFLSTKLAAFSERGQRDLYESHDLEDIVLLLDGRPELVGEMREAPKELRHYVSKSLQSLLDHFGFIEALEGHLGSLGDARTRTPIVTTRMTDIIRLDD